MESQIPPSEADNNSKPARNRTDRILNGVIVALIVATLGFGGFFGYTVYAQRQAERAADPGTRAVDLWQKQVKATPNDATIRVRFAEVLASAGRLDQAVEQLNQAIKLDPKHPGAYMDLAQLAAKRKQYADAEVYLQKVLELTAGDFSQANPRREEAYFYLGEVSLLEKKYEQAVGNFKAALRIKDTGADTYLKLAQAYEGLGATDEAIRQLEIAILFDPKYAEAHYELGKLHLKQGDKLNAAIDLRYARQLAPEEPKVQELLSTLGTVREWLGKADASLKAGNPVDAIRNVNMARALDPTDFAAALMESKLLEQRGDTKGALLAFKDALEIEPTNAEAKAGVIRVGKVEGKRLERRRDYKGALAAYRAVLGAESTDAAAKLAVARLKPLATPGKN